MTISMIIHVSTEVRTTGLVIPTGKGKHDYYDTVKPRLFPL